MASKKIEVIFDGDTGNLVRSLEDAEKELKALQKELKNTTDGANFDRLSKQIGKVKNEIGGIKSAAAAAQLNKLGRSSVDATGDLVNLGRVVQDAPFGFLGIANNLNPLIEGFKRTSSSAGGLKGGLAALGKSLTGAGGLSLLVSVASTALILFGDKLFAAAAGSKALEDSIKDSAKGIADDLVKLTTLVGVIQNVNTSTDDRAKALKALNQEYKPYLENIGLENVGLDKVGAAYEKIIDLLLRQAVVKGLQDQISEAVAETAGEIIKVQAVAEKARIERESSLKKQLTAEQKQKQQLALQAKGLQQYNKATQDGALATQGLTNAVQDQQSAFNSVDAQVGRLKDKLLEQLAPLLKLTTQYEDLGIKLDKTKDKGDKFFDDTIRRAKELSAFIEKTSFFEAGIIFNPEDTKPQQLKQALEFIERALNRAAGLGGGGLKLKAPVAFEADRFNFVKTAKYFDEQRKMAQEFREDIQKEINRLTARNPILIAFQANIEQVKKNGEALKQALASGDFANIANTLADIFGQAGIAAQDLNNKLANVAITLNGILTPAFGSFYQAIVAGENPLKAFFKSIQQSIGQLIQKLIQAVIQALILRAILGGKAGSFGDLFKSFAGFRAEGGSVSAGKSYVVGENGPEIFTAGRSGQIIPNSGGSVGAIPAAQSSGGGVWQIRGRDLALVLGRQQGFNNRNI